MTHLWVFVFLLTAPRCECLRVSGRITWGRCLWAHDSLSSLSPGVLSQVELQERAPCLLKPPQTLSLTFSTSGYSTSSDHLWSWIPQPTEKELHWVVHDYRDEDIYYNPSLKSPVTMAVDIVQTCSPCSWAQWPWRTKPCIIVTYSDRISLTCLQRTEGLDFMILSSLTQPWIPEQNQAQEGTARHFLFSSVVFFHLQHLSSL
jgi:hypothetical protein